MTQQPQRDAANQTIEGERLLDEIVAASNVKPGEDRYERVKAGVHLLMATLMKPKHESERIDMALIDALSAEIDQKLSRQLDEILHHPEFQKLESSWRGLRFVIDRVNFRENIRVELLNVSKEDLRMDFEDTPEVPKSGMYKIVYASEYGGFGGRPFGLIVGNYDFAPASQDIYLLQHCAAVAAMSHAPFIAAAGPKFFGLADFLSLPDIKNRTGMKNFPALFEGPEYSAWQSFRESEDSRYCGLVMPRFLLRLPYSRCILPSKGFNFGEDVAGEHERYLWGNAAFAFATRVADSFAKYRWCPNIIGPLAGGSVEDLPLHQYEAMGEIQTKCPIEIMLTDRREFELSEEGFIGFTYRKDADNACFFSANSAQKAKYFGQSEEGRAAELNHRLGTWLPYLFISCRFAHYLKVLHREQIGSWKERAHLERELNSWIMQYVADSGVITPAVHRQRPLRRAQIKVENVPGHHGWFKFDLKVRPHFRYMDSFVTLGLVGKLDKE